MELFLNSITVIFNTVIAILILLVLGKWMGRIKKKNNNK